jgi:hypothetical protein
METPEAFPQAVRRHLAFLIQDHGFKVVEEDQHHVRFESPTLAAEAWHDPRGEVEVRVSRLESDDPHQVWTCTGMVGRASVSRLLEIAGEQMIANPDVLRGDQVFYEQLGAEKRRLSEAWTAFYAGKGPQPTGKLPK